MYEAIEIYRIVYTSQIHPIQLLRGFLRSRIPLSKALRLATEAQRLVEVAKMQRQSAEAKVGKSAESRCFLLEERTGWLLKAWAMYVNMVNSLVPGWFIGIWNVLINVFVIDHQSRIWTKLQFQGLVLLVLGQLLLTGSRHQNGRCFWWNSPRITLEEVQGIHLWRNGGYGLPHLNMCCQVWNISSDSPLLQNQMPEKKERKKLDESISKL